MNKKLACALAFVPVVGCTFYKPLPLDNATIQQRLGPPDLNIVRVEAKTIRHPLLAPVEFSIANGLSPDEAAILAVLANPTLIAARNQRGLAQAQLVQAGILPNPELSFDMDFPKKLSNKAHPLKEVTNTLGTTVGEAIGTTAANAVVPGAGATAAGGGGGGSAGLPAGEKLVNAYALGLSWEVTSLLPFFANLKSARNHIAAVDLDLAWQEWQTAETAKYHVYRLLSLDEQLALARQAETELAENLSVVRVAVAKHEKTVVELAAAQTAFQTNHLTVLTLEQSREKERLELNKSIGFPPTVEVPLERNIRLPVLGTLPSVNELMANIDARRLDLVALRRGYESEDQKYLAAILGQFPKISLGAAHGRDTSDIVSTGFTSSFGIPIFDWNQGNVATERVTRRQLLDEYVARLFDARAEIARILVDIVSDKDQIRATEKDVRDRETLVRTYHEALQQGNADILTYYNARIELINKRIDVLKLRMDLLDQGMALELATGWYFEHPPATEKSK